MSRIFFLKKRERQIDVFVSCCMSVHAPPRASLLPCPRRVVFSPWVFYSFAPTKTTKNKKTSCRTNQKKVALALVRHDRLCVARAPCGWTWAYDPAGVIKKEKSNLWSSGRAASWAHSARNRAKNRPIKQNEKRMRKGDGVCAFVRALRQGPGTRTTRDGALPRLSPNPSGCVRKKGGFY